jgi:hypothetical protein
MKRREFIRFLATAVAGWPIVSRAQQPDQMRRIGVLMSTAADDPESRARVGALLQGLQGIRLDRRSQYTGRIPLGGGRDRPHSRLRSRTGRARTACNRTKWQPCHGGVATLDL